MVAALVALGVIAAPGAALAGTLTVSYPNATTLKVTGSPSDDGGSLSPQETMSGGAPAFTVFPGGGTTVMPAGSCEASVFTGAFRCPRTGITLISVDLGDGNDTFDTFDSASTPVSWLGGPGGDFLVGSENAADTMDGGTGDDSIVGRSGDDTVNGGDDNDTIQGNNGNDALSGGDGNDRFFGGSGDDTIHGDAGNDTLLGQDDTDTLFGDAGDDTLTGEGGNDSLDGGADNDSMDGGAGTDTDTGGDGTDIVTYIQSSAAVTVTLDGNANDGTPGENENVGGVEAVQGSNYNDSLTGDGGPNTLYGYYGDDTLRGGGGNDVLNGEFGDDSFAAEPGADTYNGGGDAGDTLSYAARNAVVTVTQDGNANDGGPGENDNVAVNM